MKRMKKIASIILAMMMVLGMSTTVFADETYSITINDTNKNHQYVAYQIFTGDLSGDTLSNIQWGDGITEAGKTAYGNAAAKAESLVGTEGRIFARDVEKYLTNPTELVYSTATESFSENGFDAGYYLIKIVAGSVDDENDAYTEFMLKVVKNVETAPKLDITEVTKKVQETNDTTGKFSWGDAADYDVGDKVPFQLTAILANNVSSYDTYKLVFNDTLSAGLTYGGDAVVKFGDTDVTDEFTINHDNGKLTIACDDVKAFGATNGSIITVEYTAELNANAVVGSTGNLNTVEGVFSNDPNHSQAGNNNTSTTPDDTVVVFTYKVIANKVTANPDFNKDAEVSADNPEYIELAGAGFTLFKVVNGEEVQLGNEITGAEMTTFEWSGLDAGSYVLKETTTPAGYNTINPIEFEISASFGIDTETNSTIITGLSGTGNNIEFTAVPKEGSLSTDVINKPGSILPTTGGIGTTIFYALGAILVLAAGATLVVRRRMSH